MWRAWTIIQGSPNKQEKSLPMFSLGLWHVSVVTLWNTVSYSIDLKKIIYYVIAHKIIYFITPEIFLRYQHLGPYYFSEVFEFYPT